MSRPGSEPPYQRSFSSIIAAKIRGAGEPEFPVSVFRLRAPLRVLDGHLQPADHSPELVAVDDDTAYLRLSGGCQGCGMASVTLSQGIEVAILDTVPEITEVVDVTDHATGSNPYYEAAKK